MCGKSNILHAMFSTHTERFINISTGKAPESVSALDGRLLKESESTLRSDLES